MNLLIVLAAFTLYGQKIDNGYVIESHPLAPPFPTLEACYTAGSKMPWTLPQNSRSLGHYYSYRMVCLDHEQVIAKDVPPIFP